jgi:hypothetical protein
MTGLYYSHLIAEKTWKEGLKSYLLQSSGVNVKMGKLMSLNDLRGDVV